MMNKEETPEIGVESKIKRVPWVVVNTPYIYVNDHKVWVKGKRKIFLYYMWRITRINWFLKKIQSKMSKERYYQIIDEVYKKYWSYTFHNSDQDKTLCKSLPGMNLGTGEITTVYCQYHPNEFLDKCKKDKEFSEKWGFSINEQDLTIQEREIYFRNEMGMKGINFMVWSLEGEEGLHNEYTKQNVPSKLITLSYNNEIIEIYE